MPASGVGRAQWCNSGKKLVAAAGRATFLQQFDAIETLLRATGKVRKKPIGGSNSLKRGIT
jgi:hypothetical protein